MSTGRVGVRRTKYNGDKYGGSATKPRHNKKASSVAKGPVPVRPVETDRRMPSGLRGVRTKKEEVGDVRRIQWFKKYHPPKGVILSRRAVTASLRAVRNRRPDFRLPLAERFGEAVRKHLSRHRIHQCLVEILRKGCYPLNTDAGMFFEVKMAGERFVIYSTFLPLEAKEKPKTKAR